MRIRTLPGRVSARIAAGEVVERPASVVKELVENAIDAGASEVDVSVGEDPCARILVVDDGDGIHPEDLAAAFGRHATSKLPGDDVSRIGTLGFRGEALPSIADVARVEVWSRRKGEACAFEIAARDGAPGEERPVGLHKGTRVQVSDLFASRPARLKFLKSRRTEMARVREAVDLAALAHPSVAFRFHSPGAVRRYEARASGAAGFAARAADVLGPDFGRDGIPFESSSAVGSVVGIACVPSRSRRDAAGITVVVNGRPVSDRVVASAVRAAYSGLMAAGMQPCAAVSVTVDPASVDVNVHPRKSEVRFADEAAVACAVTAAVSDALVAAGIRTTAALADLAAELAVPVAPDLSDRLRLPLGRVLGQANGSWIVSETLDGIVIVDQHAAHERVVYERLVASLSAPAPRRLPAPVPLGLTPVEAAALEDRMGSLAAMGYDVDFAPEGAEAHAVPEGLHAFDPADVLRSVAAAAVLDPSANPTAEILALTVATAACHAAIKAGDAVGTDRADALLREIEATPNAAHCMHGRPVVLRLGPDALARMFGR